MKYNADIAVKWFAQHDLFAVPEFQFDKSRKWRFDFVVFLLQGENYDGAEPSSIALEVEGGIWTGGRHTRGAGFKKDMEKYNRAACLGWRILRVTPDELCMQETIDMIKEALSI